MELHGRFPERHDEVDPTTVMWVASQLGVAGSAFAAFELDGRQGHRHRRTIRTFLGFRPATAGDLERLALWLSDHVLRLDPQARHGRDLALDWCRAQRLEPPALDHLRPDYPFGGAWLRSPTFGNPLLPPDHRDQGRHRSSAGRRRARLGRHPRQRDCDSRCGDLCPPQDRSGQAEAWTICSQASPSLKAWIPSA